MKKQDIEGCPKCHSSKEAMFYYRMLVDGTERMIMRCRECDYAEIVE